MKNITKHYGKLSLVERMPNSVNGNPRFRCMVIDGKGTGVSFVTKPDCCYGYAVKNLDGKQVIATVGTHYGKATLNDIAQNGAKVK